MRIVEIFLQALQILCPIAKDMPALAWEGTALPVGPCYALLAVMHIIHKIELGLK